MAAERGGTGRLLVISAAVGMAWAVVALGWGVAIDSQMIVFDGLYSLISVLLTLLSVAAFRAVRKGPTDRYPFGRPALEPLTVMVKASALAALCVYALAGAVGDLLDGGRSVSSGWGLTYAVLAALGAVVGAWYFRRRAGGDGLARAEASQWLMDGLLSAGVAVGFGVALALDVQGHPELAMLVDPAMVAVASGLFLPMPARLFLRAWRELLAAAPAALDERLSELAAQIAERHGFQDSVVRTAKIGPQLDVVVSFLVSDPETVLPVARCDAIRAELAGALPEAELEPWLDVSFTADRSWVV